MSWWQRDKTRYTVWQVQSGGSRVSAISSGLTRKDADRDARAIDCNLALFKLLAPSGPQDAHAVVLPDGEKPGCFDGGAE